MKKHSATLKGKISLTEGWQDGDREDVAELARQGESEPSFRIVVDA